MLSPGFSQLTIGAPPTNCQMNPSKLPHSFCTARNAFAFLTVPSIFNRLRTMPASFMSFRNFGALYSAIFLASNSSNAFRYASRLRKIVIHDNPACAPSNQHLEQVPIIMDRHAPLFVVIRDVERIVTAPATTSHRSVSTIDPRPPVDFVPSRQSPRIIALFHSGNSPVHEKPID